MNTSLLMNRRRALAIGAASCVANFVTPVRAGNMERPIVIELFTSQGCSSCPPADAFMQELRSMKSVIAVSLHVDYWDYLGWRDTLGDKAYSQRQHAYASRRDDGNIYTPQMIIDGGAYFVGSDKPSVKAAISRARVAAPPTWVPVALSVNERELTLSVDAHDSAPASTLWLMTVAPAIAVAIGRGENIGRNIIYYNVVRKLVSAGKWHGQALTLTLPMKGLMTPETKACVALLQTGTVGPMIGAATWGEIAA